uniref:NaTx n=1 Tax=Centruroides hentzi TaxID=88313 RepID=A0A2I9LPB7_9SCOR
MKILTVFLVFAVIYSLNIGTYCSIDRFLQVDGMYVMCLYSGLNKPYVNCTHLCQKQNATDGFCRQPHCFCTDIPDYYNRYDKKYLFD